MLGKIKGDVQMQKVCSTRYSEAVSHPSTDRARRCLTSEFVREPVYSTWYGRIGESWGMANTFLLGLIIATYMHDLKSLVYNHKEQVKYY